MNRRDFLAQSTSAAAAALALRATSDFAKAAPNDRITIAAVGLGIRGGHVLQKFASRPNVDIKYVCDVDEKALHVRSEELATKTGKRPQAIKDFRTALDDKQVDALVICTPDHWHALPMIFACQAGKDVYVEKPDGHNIIEGQTMVAAQRKYKRVVQLGTQSRSGQHFLDAMQYLREGNIGKPLFAKGWESGQQKSLGKPADTAPPAGVDYDLWLGPARVRPFNPMCFHRHWRWFYDLGSGDLGNDGVHRLDVARWAFDTALAANKEAPLGPVKSVSAHGAKCYFDDLQEWPDNLMVTYDFGIGRILTYEMRIWSPYNMEGEAEGAAVFGDKGYVVIGNTSWRAYGAKNKLLRDEKGSYGSEEAHADNFLACMSSREKPNADLETVGHPSSLLCHLGNAAYRAQRTLHFDFDNYTFGSDSDANQYLTRQEYRKPWLLPKIADL